MYNNLVFYFMRCEGKLAGGERGGPTTVIIRSLFGNFGALNNGKNAAKKISWLSHTPVVFWPKLPMVGTGPSCFPSTPLPLWCLSSTGWHCGECWRGFWCCRASFRTAVRGKRGKWGNLMGGLGTGRHPAISECNKLTIWRIWRGLRGFWCCGAGCRTFKGNEASGRGLRGFWCCGAGSCTFEGTEASGGIGGPGAGCHPAVLEYIDSLAWLLVLPGSSLACLLVLPG